jgi:hypothetical protein
VFGGAHEFHRQLTDAVEQFTSHRNAMLVVRGAREEEFDTSGHAGGAVAPTYRQL